MTLVVDIEADGLLDTVTRIWVITIYDSSDGTMKSYFNGRLEEGIERVITADKVVFHNGIGYDIPLLKKLYNVEPRGVVHDTFILSQILFANKTKMHGLKYWGNYFNVPKPVHEDWTQFSEEMVYRNREDVKITKMLWNKINLQLKKVGLNISDALDLEYSTYKTACKSFDRGWEFDLDRANNLIVRLTKLKELLTNKIHSHLPLITTTKTYKTIYKKDGTHHSYVTKLLQNTEWSIVNGTTLSHTTKVNISSSFQLASVLIDLGWIPNEYNYKKDKRKRPIKDENGQLIQTSPKLSESDFLGLNPELAKLLRRMGSVSNRLGVISGWLKSVQDGRLPIFAHTCGTNTTRWRHRGLVNVPKTGAGVFMGWHMRSLFTAPPGKVLVGCDAAQLEARIEGALTHIYDNGKYARFLLEDDVHSYNATIFGCSRDQAKGAGYCLAYGGGAGKLAKLLGCSFKQASILHEDYWDSRPASKKLKTALEKSVQSLGYNKRDDLWDKAAYIKAIDGRPIFVRSWHSLVNSMIQSAGMICMKKGYELLDEYLTNEQIDAIIIMMYHDEYVVIANPEDAERVGYLAEKAILEAGKHFKLKVPLEAKAQIGNTWADIH